jgi:hypothetical protein
VGSSDQRGHQDQLGALGLVLNAVVLFNTRYMDPAVTKLRARGFEVRDEDVARLSPFHPRAREPAELHVMRHPA